jgi:UDP-N-acetylmuramate dehydrogenase
MLSIEYIRTMCSGRVAIGEPLAHMTTFRIGGPADILLEPVTAAEVTALVGHLRGLNVPFIVLGNGSNVLVSDEGFRGAAITLEHGFSTASFEDGIVEAGAGMRLATFVEFCIAHGRAGVEMLAGIPGTLGGAIIMNAGAYGGEISTHLVDVTVVHGNEIVTRTASECGFRYRASALTGDVVLSARFQMPDGDIDELRAKRKELLLKRKAAQPTQLPNAGSIFKNPEGGFAAKLIQESGLKGFRIGGAEVSEQHANFIVCTGEATAADVVAVINHVRRAVFARTGVALELEIKLIGFPANVLEPLGEGGAQ